MFCQEKKFGALSHNFSYFTRRIISGNISELGVPGYDVTTWQPDSTSPRKMAP